MTTPATVNLSAQDYFSTTLSSGITTTTTVIPLAAVPTGTEGFLVIDPDNASKEIIFYNSKTSSTVTVPSTADRGRGGTSAVSHSSSAVVKCMVVAEYFTEIYNGHALATVALATTTISNPYKFFAYHNATQSLSSGATTAFNTEVYDTNNNFASNTYTVPVNGFYQFTVQNYLSSSPTFSYTQIVKNASTFYQGNGVSGSTGDVQVTATPPPIQCTAGDTITSSHVHTGGGLITLAAGSSTSLVTYFGGFLVSQT